jgi:hypothetical protein
MIWLRSRQPHQVNAISHRRSCNAQGARTNFDDCKHSLFTRPNGHREMGLSGLESLLPRLRSLPAIRLLPSGSRALRSLPAMMSSRGSNPAGFGQVNLKIMFSMPAETEHTQGKKVLRDMCQQKTDWRSDGVSDIRSTYGPWHALPSSLGLARLFGKVAELGRWNLDC